METVRPVPTEAVVVPDESIDPALPPLEVDWDAAPAVPSPVLVVGSARARAIGESGCPSLIYAPADEKMGRQVEMLRDCAVNPVLTFTKPVRATVGSSLAFKAPKGWGLGAQVVADAEPYGPFWIIEANRLNARPDGRTFLADAHGGGWVELARGEELNTGELDAIAPGASGQYLVSVPVQIGQVARTWRTYGRTYYWVRVR